MEIFAHHDLSPVFSLKKKKEKRSSNVSHLMLRIFASSHFYSFFHLRYFSFPILESEHKIYELMFLRGLISFSLEVKTHFCSILLFLCILGFLGETKDGDETPFKLPTHSDT